MGTNDLAGFLFEIASVERLAILAALAQRALKHAEISRVGSMTGSETTRHLNRMVAAGLVAKNVRGEYAPTTLGHVVGAVLPLFSFLNSHRDYLLAHDVRAVKPSFVARLGELGHGTFTTGTYQVIAVQEDALRAVRRRAWIVTQQRFEQALPILRARSDQGADVRVLRPAPAIREEIRAHARVERNFPVRVLDEVKVFLAVLDDQAGVCFPALDGRVDMASMILLRDPGGLGWAEDLFVDLWGRARPSHVPLRSRATRPRGNAHSVDRTASAGGSRAARKDGPTIATRTKR